MAYRTPVGGRWPTWYQPLDLEAMQFVWGANPEAPSQDQQPADPLIGQSIRASIGEVLRGGYGRNRYSVANDGITDWILISPDRFRKRSRSAKARRQGRGRNALVEADLFQLVLHVDAHSLTHAFHSRGTK